MTVAEEREERIRQRALRSGRKMENVTETMNGTGSRPLTKSTRRPRGVRRGAKAAWRRTSNRARCNRAVDRATARRALETTATWKRGAQGEAAALPDGVERAAKTPPIRARSANIGPLEHRRSA